MNCSPNQLIMKYVCFFNGIAVLLRHGLYSISGERKDCQKPQGIRSLVLVTFCILFLSIVKVDGQSETPENISWFNFELHKQEKGFNLDKPHHNMMLDVYFGNLPVSAKMLFSMSSPRSMLYDFVFEDLKYRSSSIRNKTKTMQGIGKSQKYYLSEIDILVDENLLGVDNLDIYNTRDADKENLYKGILGFGMFLRANKILLIDNMNKRLAAVDDLPDYIEQNAKFVPMVVESGYLKIPVVVDEKEYFAFYDGSARPALIVYQKGLFKDMSTDREVKDQLMLPDGDFDVKYVKGYQASAENEILFAGLPLEKFNVYYTKEKQPGKVKLSVSHAFFSNYLMIFDYKNNRFGLLEDKYFMDLQKKK